MAVVGNKRADRGAGKERRLRQPGEDGEDSAANTA